MRVRTVIALALATLALAGAGPPAAPVSPAGLAAEIEGYLAELRKRELRTDEVTPWVVLHAVVAFHQGVTVDDRRVGGGPMDAVRWLMTRATHGGRSIYEVVDGAPSVRTRKPKAPYFEIQDHVDQYLHLLAEVGVPTTSPVVATGGRRFAVSDLVEAAQRGFRPDQELAFTLIALSSYVPADRTWRAADGKEYRVADLLRLAIERDAKKETEGGPHHLYGVAYTVRRLQAAPVAADPALLRGAQAYLRRHVALARTFQQDDGALSGSVFEMSSKPVSPSHLVNTTGHGLEWLAITLSREELREPWVMRAATRLLRELKAHPRRTFSEGGLYHAAHALRLYRAALVEGRP